ncbi:MAG: hypothetical protein GY834_08130 [Bacteroidetes bacterium]|nr:hypothetical protein [Bacteroidota bacterium]
MEDTNVVFKLKKLAVDPSSKVRIATIFPLLSHTQELLASSVFKKEVTEKGEFGFDTPTPFYAPNSFEEYKIRILKKNSTFLEELRRFLDIKNLDKMVKMRIAVTVYHTGYKELAKKIAKNILLEVYGDSPATSWAQWLLNGFE